VYPTPAALASRIFGAKKKYENPWRFLKKRRRSSYRKTIVRSYLLLKFLLWYERRAFSQKPRSPKNLHISKSFFFQNAKVVLWCRFWGLWPKKGLWLEWRAFFMREAPDAVLDPFKSASGVDSGHFSQRRFFGAILQPPWTALGPSCRSLEFFLGLPIL
jgi:hypothetical protein